MGLIKNHINPYIGSGMSALCSNESIEVLERVNRSTVLFKFPHVMPKNATTTLVLKAPKTESSNRVIYLIDELHRVQEQQRECQAMLGDEDHDYDLVVAQLNGTSMNH